MMEYPADDSLDLSDEELATAIPTGSVEELGKRILEPWPCPECQAEPVRTLFKKLRRGVHFYSRVTMTCPQGHRASKLFETTWFRRSPA